MSRDGDGRGGGIYSSRLTGGVYCDIKKSYRSDSRNINKCRSVRRGAGPDADL